MPFPDELARGLAVVAYDHRWPGDFTVLAEQIQGALGPAAVQISHVGSTSVPGLAAGWTSADAGLPHMVASRCR